MKLLLQKSDSRLVCVVPSDITFEWAEEGLTFVNPNGTRSVQEDVHAVDFSVVDFPGTVEDLPDFTKIWAYVDGAFVEIEPPKRPDTPA